MALREVLTAWSMVLALMPIAMGHAAAQALPPNTFLESLRTSIVQAIGAQDNSVETAIKGNILTVSRVNSTLNEATHGARNSEATAIGTVVAKALADKPEYKHIHTLRIQYVRQASPGARRKTLDTVDFRKDPSGTFQMHMT